MGQVSFVFYFILATFLAAIGVWLALAEAVLTNWPDGSQQAVFKASLTYFPAMGSLACLQVVVMEDEKKYLRSFFFFLLIFFVVLAVLAGGATILNDSYMAWLLVIIGTVTALLSYWISISQEDRLMDNAPPKAVLGGDTEADLVGDTAGFKV